MTYEDDELLISSPKENITAPEGHAIYNFLHP